MNFLKRAIRYSFRQRMRSLILFLTFTILATTALVCISSGKAAQAGTNEVKETIGASVRIQLDESPENYGEPEASGNGYSYVYKGDWLSKKIIDEIAALPKVVNINGKDETGFYGLPDSFEPFWGMIQDPNLSTPYQAILNSAMDAKFLNGTYKLEEGRHIQADDSYAALISKELAEKNKLSVGDKITFRNDINSSETSTFTIVGIFSGTEGMSKSAITPDGIPANCGYIDMNSINEIYYKEEGHEGYSYLDVYANSVEDAEELLTTIKNLPSMKGKTFTYQVNSEDFDLIAKPLSSLNHMINTAVTVITVVGAMIIVLLLVLWTRSRKKEIGILLALGKSKGEIIGQFLIENWLIGIFSVIASGGLAIALADKVGSFIINKSGESVSDLTVRIAATDMATVYGIGFVVVSLAVMVASYTVIRLKPRDILTKMD